MFLHTRSNRDLVDLPCRMDLPYRPEMPRKPDGGAAVLTDAVKRFLSF